MNATGPVFWLVIVAAALVVAMFLVRRKGNISRARKLLHERLECERLCSLLTRELIVKAQGHRLEALEKAARKRLYNQAGTA